MLCRKSLSFNCILLASTALAATPALAQDAGNPQFLGSIVLRVINDGGEGVSNTQAANTAGARVPVDLADLPRSLTILPSELFEAQGARTFEETAAYSPGIVTETFGQDNRYDEFILRGFEAQIGGVLRDGMSLRTVDWASWRTEPFGLESVNILRGPSSDLYGEGEPGGLINGVSKRPEFSFGGELRAAFTSDEGYELGVDVTGPISDTLAYRLIALGNVSGSNYDAVDTGRLYFAPSLTWQPTDQTSLTLYGQYQRDEVGDSYILVPQAGTLLPNGNGSFGPDTYTGNPGYNTIETTQSYLGYEFDHEFSPSLSFMSRARFSQNDWDNRTEYPAAFVNLSYLLPSPPFGGPVGLPGDIDTALMTVFNVDQEMRQVSFDNALVYSFDTGAASGDIAFGVDYYGVDSNTIWGLGYTGERNLLNGTVTNFLGAGFPADLPSQRFIDLDQIGLYVNGHSEIGDRFLLSGGLRWDSIEYTSRGVNSLPVPSPVPGGGFVAATIPFNNTLDEEFFSGNLGLGYRLSETTMLYGSASRGFNLAPAGTLASGAGLDLEESESYEIGLRFNSLDGNTSISAALFDITKSNVAFPHPTIAVPGFFVQVGEVRSRGLELEATHDFGNGLSLFGSMTFVDAEVSNDARFNGNQPARAPEFSAAAFAQYEVQQVPGLALGLGLRHTGERYADIANTYQIDAVTLVDASISYTMDDWQLMLAARNIADREYLGYCGNATIQLGVPALDAVSGNCVYGAGREFSLTLRSLF